MAGKRKKDEAAGSDVSMKQLLSDAAPSIEDASLPRGGASALMPAEKGGTGEEDGSFGDILNGELPNSVENLGYKDEGQLPGDAQARQKWRERKFPNETPEDAKRWRKSLGKGPKRKKLEAGALTDVQAQNLLDKKGAKPVNFKKYERGSQATLKNIADKKLRGQLVQREKLFGEAALTASKVEQWLLPSEAGYLEADGLEDTRHFSQEAIVKEVDITSAQKAFDLKLPDLGSYTLDYNSNGRCLLLGGRKGHLAMMDWKQSRLMMEIQVRETTRDVKFLHNETFFAVAQKKYVFIYDKKGVEIHCMRDHISPLKLEFLPHHFLLASVDKAGILRYQDTSTGLMVAQHRTHLGRGGVMRMNPFNSVLGLGHSNGTVTMWSPNMSTPLITILCHHGPLATVAFEREGLQMVTGGIDGKVKVWDVRKLVPLHTYYAPTTPNSLDISQKGLLAVGCGSKIEIWRDALSTKQSKPYMTHRLANGAQAEDLSFCPYEDVLAVGHSLGISSMLVPGSGEPNFDSFVANPFETPKQHREVEVHRLLDKLPPELIVLDPNQIGGILRSGRENQMEKLSLGKEANFANSIAAGKEVKLKHKAKGRDKPSKRHRKKQLNVITVKRAMIADQAKAKAKATPAEPANDGDDPVPRALARFKRK